MRFTSKQQFLGLMDEEWGNLCETLAAIPPAALESAPLWGAGRTGKDVLMHLYEWHVMNLGWYKTGLKGVPDMPAKGFTWKENPALNEAIYQKHRRVPLARARALLRASHTRVLKLLRSLSEEQLLKPGYYPWCGRQSKLPLTSYFHANTTSHYKWARRKLMKLQQESHPPSAGSLRIPSK